MSSNPIVLLRFQNGEIVPVMTELIKSDATMTRWEASTHEHIGLTKYHYAEYIDDGRLEINAHKCSIVGTTDSFVCTIHYFSPMVCQYIYYLAINSDMIIFPVDPFATVMVSQNQREQLSVEWEEKYGKPIFCDSAETLEPILAEGFFAWLNYRNRVMPNDATNPEAGNNSDVQ